jgi:hypothetical protein
VHGDVKIDPCNPDVSGRLACTRETIALISLDADIWTGYTVHLAICDVEKY